MRSPILAGRDSSALKEAREQQRGIAARLQFALAASQMGEWDMDLATRVVRRSLRFDQCFGYTAPVADWPLEKFFEHIHADDRTWVQMHTLAALEQRTSLRYECRVVWPDGSEHWISVHGGVHERPDKGPHMLGVVADISERIHSEHTLQEAKRAKDSVLELLAQQLRGRLAPLRAAARALELHADDAARRSGSAQQIVLHAAEMANLVDSLLEVARVTQGQVPLAQTPLTMQDIVADAVSQARPLIDQRRQRLLLELEAQPAPIWGDGERLAQALFKLLDNAARYTPEGGNIALRMHCGEQQIVLEISDDGGGMAPDMLARAFEPFARAGARAPNVAPDGLGLGLTLARGLIEQHGGSLTAHSAGLGAGSRLTVTLPQLGRLAGAMNVPPAAAWR